MKQSIFISLILLASPLAFGEGKNAKMSSESSEMNTRSSTNSNDRYDNLDIRTNSRSTPASIGNEDRQLGADITSERYQWQSDQPATAVTGTSTAPQESTALMYEEDVAVSETSDSPSLSGSSTSAAGTAGGMAATTDEKNKEMKSSTAYSADKTAQDTATSKQSTELVRKIRSEITDSEDLSISAHNVKIISENNQIFLKGPVKSAAEKAKVEEIAKRMAGNTAVINQTYVELR